MASDQELQKTFKLWGDNEGTLHLEMLKNVDDVASNVRQAELISQKLVQIFADNENRVFNCLVDMTAIKAGAHYPSPQARQIYASVLDNRQFKKIAIIAPNALLQAIMKFIIYAANKKNKVKIFKNNKSAVDWLKN